MKTNHNYLISTISALFLCMQTINAQKTYLITGKLPTEKELEIRVMGYNIIKDTLLGQTKTDLNGNFTINYPKNYIGAATFQIKDGTSFILLLNNENFNFEWSDFKDFNTLKFKNSKENDYFKEAFDINNISNKKLMGLRYLKNLYKTDITNTSTSQLFYKQLEKEITDNTMQFEKYVAGLPITTYSKGYLKYRKIVQDIQEAKQKKEMSEIVEKEFKDIDFGNEVLQHSGLIKEILESYLEIVMTKVEDKAAKEERLIKITDTILDKIKANPTVLNQISEYLFKYYEKYSLSKVAEHTALSILGNNKCMVDDKRIALFEQYRKMAIGNLATNLEFTTTAQYKSLMEIKSKFKVVIFGASWCEECKNEIPQFKDYAEIFKTKYDAEIIFISIDTDKEKYNVFIKDLPFINSCDFKGWESINVKNYCVFATPFIYVLNEQNKIVAKPLNATDTAKWLFEKSKN